MRCGGSADGLLWTLSATLSTVENRERDYAGLRGPYPHLAVRQQIVCNNCFMISPKYSTSKEKSSSLLSKIEDAAPFQFGISICHRPAQRAVLRVRHVEHASDRFHQMFIAMPTNQWQCSPSSELALTVRATPRVSNVHEYRSADK